jgi:PAS domain S-box-containing protein
MISAACQEGNTRPRSAFNLLLVRFVRIEQQAILYASVISLRFSGYEPAIAAKAIALCSQGPHEKGGIEMGTDRKAPNLEQSSEALYEQRRWLQVTLSSIGDAVITTDREGNVTFLNPVAQSLTGWSQEEAAGVALDKVFKIVNEKTRQTVENPATRALRDGLVVGLANHTLLIAKDGKEGPIDDSAAPIRNANGEVAGVVLVFRDITERRRQEQAIQDSLNYCESIIATLREPFLVLDEKLRVKTANHRFYETFKVAPEETENRFIYDLGNGQWDIPELRGLLTEVLSNHHPIHDFEIERAFPTIGRKTMELNASRFESVNHEPDLILLAIEDITERKQAEDSLRDSEVRYRRLFESAKDGILILDATTGRVTDANPYIEEVLGYAPDELSGKELWQIGLFQDIEESKAAFQRLQKQGYIRYHNLPLETKDGQRREVEFVSNVYPEDHHHVIQCNIRDITERTKLERTMAQAEALADLHRRKDEFLAMLSHELRNPLAPILNATHLLSLQKDENHIQKQARTIIERQVGQLAHLVDDLLDISRVTTGKIRLHEEDTDLRGIIERAIEATRPLIEQRKHELTVTLSPDPIWLRADVTRIEQVVVNLLNNAAKYTDEGGHIWLTADQEGDFALLQVRDNGVGIAPELIPHIFDLFTQGNRSLERAQGGLGIGLTLVQKIVELHRGSVEAKSAGTGKGSEFTVRLPLMVSEPSQKAMPAAPVLPSSHTARVLVVDDNADAADSIAMILRLSGYDVQVAYSGQSALETAIEYQPSIILLDVGLPEMDGYEIARRLRQRPQLSDAWLIALTGYGQDSDRQQSQEAGFDYHLVKPVNTQELEALVANLTKEQRSLK